MQPRKCPHCEKSMAVDANYSFDSNLNLVCQCGEIAFATDWKTNSDIDNVVRLKKGAYHNYSGNFPNGVNNNQNNQYYPGELFPKKNLKLHQKKLERQTQPSQKEKNTTNGLTPRTFQDYVVGGRKLRMVLPASKPPMMPS